MHEQETELTVVDPAEQASAPAGEEPVLETVAPASEAAGPEETVSRAAYDQLKGERDQLVDRLARMQAEFDNARKRAAWWSSFCLWWTTLSWRSSLRELRSNCGTAWN
jgi:molecular chaperone GrpE (heat shock protein)